MPITEHLYPQNPKSELTAGIQKNYNSAQSYYFQRRQLFLDYLKRSLITAPDIDKDMTAQIKDIWNKNIYGVMQGIFRSGLEQNLSVQQMQQEVTSRFNLSPEIMKYLTRAVTYDSKHFRNFLGDLGQAFEVWLAEYVIDIIKKGAYFESAQVNNLINAFVSGAMSSTSAIVEGQKNIRSDVIISPYIKMDFIKDNNGVLKTPQNLPLELQFKMNLDFTNSLPTAEEIISDRSILKEFLKPDIGNIFGLSAKSWTKSDGKKFMESSVMKKYLNAIFNQTDSKGFRHSWEPDYTIEYVAYYLSHRIVEIVSPTTVALTSRSGLIWMDEFLSQHMFYMNVQIEKFARKNRGKDTSKKKNLKRVFPQILDSNIYVRNYEMGKAFNLSLTEHRTQKGTNHWIDLKITQGT